MTTSLILKRFKDLGITAQEARCYISLLEKDSLTVPEISRIAKIARPNAYEALEKLLAKGFCISKPGKTKRYAAADPSFLRDKISAEINIELDTELNEQAEISRRNLKKKEQEILDKKRNAVENVNNIVKELTPLYKNSRFNENPLEYIEIIKDPALAAKRFIQLNEKVEYEKVGFCKGPFTGNKEKLMEQVKIQCQRSATNPRRTRIIYEMKDDSDNWLFEFIDLAVRHAREEARILKSLPLKASIFDEKFIMLSLPDPVSNKSSFTTMVIEHRDLIRALKMLFEMLWEQAEDFHILQD